MRWPQAVTQSQDPSGLLFSMRAWPAVLFWWSDEADPAGVRGVGRALGERDGVVHLHPARVAAGAAGCAAAAVAGQDVGAAAGAGGR